MTDFDQFWAAYPKRVAKGAAYKAWVKLKPPLAEVLAALEWQVNQPGWRKDGGQWVPHASTWLHSWGWQDEPFHPVATGRPRMPHDWRSECAATHDSRCTNATFHSAKMAEQAEAQS